MGTAWDGLARVIYGTGFKKKKKTKKQSAHPLSTKSVELGVPIYHVHMELFLLSSLEDDLQSDVERPFMLLVGLRRQRSTHAPLH